jgi:hypothetical protein
MRILEGTGLEQLIREAERLPTDYSSKAIAQPGEEKIAGASPIIGKLLALKKIYKQRAKEAADAGRDEERQACYDTQNLLGLLADNEFRWQIRTYPRRKHMHLRSNGEIVCAPPEAAQAA